MAETRLGAGRQTSVPPRPRPWNDPTVRAVVYQVVLIAAVVGVGAYLVSNTLDNLARRNIRTGYGFFDQEAGFFISESLSR